MSEALEPQYPRQTTYREIRRVFGTRMTLQTIGTQTEPVEFVVDIEAEVRYYALRNPTLATQVAE